MMNIEIEKNNKANMENRLKAYAEKLAEKKGERKIKEEHKR